MSLRFRETLCKFKSKAELITWHTTCPQIIDSNTRQAHYGYIEMISLSWHSSSPSSITQPAPQIWLNVNMFTAISFYLLQSLCRT